ncbi:Vta1 like-domain-containing protein [Irpex rosettiformis]|uniref:Vta1 like-domain-containing protein n=1 Tax=Irpex rosettiformis TaxID=378272 RepID=A0ACB8UKZ2_9APHY|nr:Vta1 like-domain-containing protein [Irpex rosettiformis]
MGALNLPPVPAELKSVTPYLQRAEEVKSTDPIIAYWCAYHAAQIGISLKVKDNNARTFLFDLLDILEKTKSEIGPNDAIDDESASSAYVENFALRVFTIADNEDRRGNATRGTAKKFLAAANFLEVLSVVSTSTPPTINVPEKIRYAKWKAADIAKAFREGRKPTSGGVGEQLELEEEAAPADGERIIPPAIQRPTPPPGPIIDMSGSPPEAHILREGIAGHKESVTSPGGWSTVATPGANTTRNEHISFQLKGAQRQAWVSEDIEGTNAGTEPQELSGLGSSAAIQRPELPTESSDTGSKKVRFTPSAIGGLTPPTADGEEDPFLKVSVPPSLDPEEYLQYRETPSAPPLDSSTQLPPGFVLPPVHPPPPLLPTTSTHPVPPPPTLFYPTRPEPQTQIQTVAIPPPGVLSSDSTFTQTPEDLTPQVIARVQKHCKFAISALDYEDAEQARKELRAALGMLGG